MPARRAASALPPTAKVRRPKVVRLSSTQPATATSAKMITSAGMPKTEPLKKSRKSLVLDDLRPPVGEDLGQAAGRGEHRQGRDERDELAVGDDDAVDQPGTRAHRERGEHHDDPVEVLGESLGGQGGGPHRRQRDQGAHRQVDAAADDHERHAHADDADHRGQLQDRQHVVDVGEPVAGGDHADDAEDRQGDDQAEVAPDRAGQEAGPVARLRLRSRGAAARSSRSSLMPRPLRAV